MTRPAKINAKVQDRICKALLACNTLEAAAAYGGVHYDTMNNWRNRGKAEIARLAKDKRRKPKKSEAIYVEFFESIKNAIDESEAMLIAEIRAHGRKQWVALAWLAERRWRDRWARPKQIEITGKDGGPVKSELTGDAKQLMELFKDIDDAKDKK